MKGKKYELQGVARFVGTIGAPNLMYTRETWVCTNRFASRVQAARWISETDG